MGENSKIEWTDHTFNPWRGCQKVAAGCANCYAEALSMRNPGTLGIWGSEEQGATRVVASEATWRGPVKWNAKRDEEPTQCVQCGHVESIEAFDVGGADPGMLFCPRCSSQTPNEEAQRPRVFCASLCDVFETWSGQLVDSSGNNLIQCTCGFSGSHRSLVLHANFDCPAASELPSLALDDVRARLFRLIDATPNLDWILLTKRPENIRRMWPAREGCLDGTASTPDELATHVTAYRRNVWLLTSIATQADADRNIPELLKCRDLAPVLGVSAEPLIEAVDLGPPERWAATSTRGGIGWVIGGGESGSNARPCNVAWLRSLRDQCEAASVPFFLKQLGAVVHDEFRSTGDPAEWTSGVRVRQVSEETYRVMTSDRKGGDWDEWPADLRVRELPR